MAVSWTGGVGLVLEVAQELRALVPYGVLPQRMAMCPRLGELANVPTHATRGAAAAALESLITRTLETFEGNAPRAYRLLLLLGKEAEDAHHLGGVEERRSQARSAIESPDVPKQWKCDGELMFLLFLAERCIQLANTKAAEPVAASASDVGSYDIDYFGYFMELGADGTTRDYTKTVIIHALTDGVATFRHPVEKPLQYLGEWSDSQIGPRVVQGGTIQEVAPAGKVLSHVTVALPRPLRRGERHSLTLQWRRHEGRRERSWIVIRPSVVIRTAIVASVFFPENLLTDVRAFQAPSAITESQYLTEEFMEQPMVSEPSYAEHQFVHPVPRTAYGLVWNWRE